MTAPNPHSQAMRDANRAGYVKALRDGRRQRATTVPARKGAGSYRRRAKHAKGGEA